MVNADCDVLGLHPVGATNADVSIDEMLKLFKDEKFCALLDYAKECGLEIEYAMHSARFLLPAKEFLENPGYFRMNKDGVRTADLNFCVSNNDALEFYAQRALQLAKQLYKTSNTFYFWLDDANGAFCHCEKCAKFSPSDQQLKVLNYVIRRLRSEIPGARLSYLAYFECMECPETIKPEEGIFLEYAPFERDFTKRADEIACEQKRNIEKLLDFFGKEDARVLEYWYDNSLFSKWKKPTVKFSPDNEMIKADLEFYRNLGFNDIASFACNLGEDYEALYGESDISAF